MLNQYLPNTYHQYLTDTYMINPYLIDPCTHAKLIPGVILGQNIIRLSGAALNDWFFKKFVLSKAV